MAGQDLRKRLRRRMRGAPPGPKTTPCRGPDPAAAGAAPILYRRDLPHSPDPRLQAFEVTAPHVELADAVQGVEARTGAGEHALVVETPLPDLDPKWTDLCETFRRAVTGPAPGLGIHLADVCGQAPPRLEDILFLDLETTGLSSSPLFLIGAMVWRDGRLVARQFFARDYSEERAVVELFAEEAAGRRLLVSFNGKSFDLPYVRVRAAATGGPFALNMAHLDLLHVCRRVYGRSFGDCRLQTLERAVCGRLRHGDIPGHLIPQAYHDFVRTGNARQMAECLKHNLLDLVTLADLMTRLPAPQ